jgi:hypothetical protein
MRTGDEKQVRRLINEIVEGVISEGTTSHDDGVANYQGTGTQASKERMRRFKELSIERGINTDWEAADRWNRAERYNGQSSLGMNKSVYNLLANYGKRASKLFGELQNELKNMDVDAEIRDAIRELKEKSYFLAHNQYDKGLLKRNWAGEPNPRYKR